MMVAVKWLKGQTKLVEWWNTCQLFVNMQKKKWYGHCKYTESKSKVQMTFPMSWGPKSCLHRLLEMSVTVTFLSSSPLTSILYTNIIYSRMIYKAMLSFWDLYCCIYDFYESGKCSITPDTSRQNGTMELAPSTNNSVVQFIWKLHRWKDWRMMAGSSVVAVLWLWSWAGKCDDISLMMHWWPQDTDIK